MDGAKVLLVLALIAIIAILYFPQRSFFAQSKTTQSDQLEKYLLSLGTWSSSEASKAKQYYASIMKVCGPLISGDLWYHLDSFGIDKHDLSTSAPKEMLIRLRQRSIVVHSKDGFKFCSG